MSDGEVLDPAAIAELRRAQEQFGNPGFIGQLAGLFLQNAPRRMDELRGAAAARDAAALEGAAHALKTSCAMFGALRLAACCARLEDAAGRSDFSGVNALLDQAEAVWPAVQDAVAALAGRG